MWSWTNRNSHLSIYNLAEVIILQYLAKRCDRIYISCQTKHVKSFFFLMVKWQKRFFIKAVKLKHWTISFVVVIWQTNGAVQPHHDGKAVLHNSWSHGYNIHSGEQIQIPPTFTGISEFEPVMTNHKCAGNNTGKNGEQQNRLSAPIMFGVQLSATTNRN